jgi:hypothetical protein
MGRPRDKRTSLPWPEPLEAILERAGESRFSRTRSPIASQVWRDAVGARIAERAFPLSLFGGVLLLRVPSSVWAHELSLLADVVCERLQELGVGARELRFRVGAVPAVERPAERRIARAVPAPGALPLEVVRSLGGVVDHDLRASIARAAAANLAWQMATRPTPALAITEARRAARAPRSAEGEIAPPDPARPACRAAAPNTPAGAPDRRR